METRDRTRDVVPYRVEDAERLGLHAAIILAQLRYWLERSAHDYDGRKWIFKTYRQWVKETSLTKSQVRRACAVLENLHVIDSTTKYSDARKGPPDLKWYALSEEQVPPVARASEPSEVQVPQRVRGSDRAGAAGGRAGAADGTVRKTTTETRERKTTSSPAARSSSSEPSPTEEEEPELSPEEVTRNREEALSAAGLVEVTDPDEIAAQRRWLEGEEPDEEPAPDPDAPFAP